MDSPTDRVHAERQSGNAATAENRLQDACDHFRAAVEHARRQDDASLLAHALRHLGSALARLDRLPEALACCDEALAIYSSEPRTDPLDLANAQRARAVVRDRAGRDDAARDWQDALQGYEVAGVQAGIDECRARLSR